MTITKAVREGARLLGECNIDNADYDSFAILSDIMNFDRTFYLVHADEEVDEQIYSEFIEKIKRRCLHEPLQHITGKQWFYGYEFNVNSDVLVPRADTEILVEEALKVLKPGGEILDMCTGSGCIIISLYLKSSPARAAGVDLSKKALQVAKENAKKLGADSVEFINSDLFENVAQHRYDVIVSNPPYIETEVIKGLSEEVRLHDPMMALDGKEDGLHFYRLITKQACSYLKAGGWLMYEIGYNQAEEVSKIMMDAGFKDVRVTKDLAGLDRVVQGRF